MKKILMISTILILALSMFSISFATEATPIMSDVALTVDRQDEIYTFKASDFQTVFNNLDVGALDRVIIISLPTSSAGKLQLSEKDITTLPTGIAIGDIENLTFIPDENFTGKTQFTWRGKTADNSYATVFTTEITVTDEYANMIVDIPIYVNEEYQFKASDFSTVFKAKEELELSRVVIASLPTATTGSLELTETAITTVPTGVDLSKISELKFVPTEDYIGTATFTWRGKSDTTSGTTVFTTNFIISERPAMTAKDKNLVINKNTTIISYLEATYSEKAKFEIVTYPKNGQISSFNADTGEFKYSPIVDYVGTDEFTFKATRYGKDSTIGKVAITILETEPIIPFHYVDMQENWANYSASHLAAMNIIVGENINGDYFFYPDKVITRADFIVAMLGALGIHTDDITTTFKFSDDAIIETWLKPYVYKAYEEGIINGSYDNGNIYFYPNRNITRAEAATIINNSIKLAYNNNDALSFTDSLQIPTWSLKAIKNMVGYQIINGYVDNTFKPEINITKAELAEMLYKAIKEKENEINNPNSNGTIIELK